MNYTWNFAQITDAQDLLNLSVKVQDEVDTIFNFDPNVLAHHIVLGIVNQYYTGQSELVAVARDADNSIIAYTWAKSGDTTMWSAEQTVSVRMAHVDPDLSARLRIQLIKDMLLIWERFAQIVKCPIITSNSIRKDQNVFMRLHEQAGYTVRGGNAFKRVDLSIVPNSLF